MPRLNNNIPLYDQKAVVKKIRKKTDELEKILRDARDHGIHGKITILTTENVVQVKEELNYT